jgi:hypothetical protein
MRLLGILVVAVSLSASEPFPPLEHMALIREADLRYKPKRTKPLEVKQEEPSSVAKELSKQMAEPRPLTAAEVEELKSQMDRHFREYPGFIPDFRGTAPSMDKQIQRYREQRSALKKTDQAK